MPFDFVAYDQKCAALTAEELQREWQHYTRLITGAATSTTVSGLALPLTLGVSSVGIAMAAPAIHNARKKREIIERHLQRHNAHHVTRKRDVLGGAAVSGTIGVVTLGVGTMGADAVAQQGAEHGINAIVANETAIKVVTHAALDGVGMGVEHLHTDRVKKREAKKAFEKAGVFQAVQEAKAQEAGYGNHQNNMNQYQHPYALHAQHTGASSSRLSVMSPPPPYNAPQEQSVPLQQPTQYQPTALNVPAYVAQGHQQYATLDAKVDPTVVEQRWASQNATMQHHPTTTVFYQVSPPENILSPPIPPKETMTPTPAVPFSQGNGGPEGPQQTEMDDLIANVEQQLKVTETALSSQSGSVPPMSYHATPIVDYYELEGTQEVVAQQPTHQRALDSTCPQPASSGSVEANHIPRTPQPTSTVSQHQVVFNQPDTARQHISPGHIEAPPTQCSEAVAQQVPLPSEQVALPHQSDAPPILGPRPPLQVESPPALSYMQPTSPGQQSVSTENLPVTPLSTGSSHYQQRNGPLPHVVQPTPLHNISPLPQPYLPTPLTPPSLEPTPQIHYQQPGQLPGFYAPSPMANQPRQPPQQYTSQYGTYFPPPPASAVAPTPQPSLPPASPPTPNPVMSKRRSIMAAVALKAQQTLAHHRTPSGSVYNQPQYSSPSPQPQGQPQIPYSAQQYTYQPPQPWSQHQQQTNSNPQYQHPQHIPEEPAYAPVPLPKAYSTQPQLPPTPMSPPNIPTVQYAGQQQQQQHPGYFS